MKDVGVGLALTVGVTGVLYLVWGPDAVMPGAVFGLLATVISVAVGGSVAVRGGGDVEARHVPAVAHGDRVPGGADPPPVLRNATAAE
jgi:hypothetical protein